MKHIDFSTKKAYSTLFMISVNIKSSDATVLIRLHKMHILPHTAGKSGIRISKNVVKVKKIQQIFARVLWYETASFPDRTVLLAFHCVAYNAESS